MMTKEKEPVEETEPEEEQHQDMLFDIRSRIDEMRTDEDTKPPVDLDHADMPEEMQKAILQYQIKAEIARKLQDKFNPNVTWFGTHVVNSNTKRMDNLRHLGEYDSTCIVRRIPYLRNRGIDTKIRTTSEYQMCRSNPEIGGFDRKMQYTSIRRDNVDVNQRQQITGNNPKKKSGLFSALNPFKKKEDA